MNRPPDINEALWRRVERLSPKGVVIPDFGILLDTHRDLPHIGSFDADLHRGQCKPTPVMYHPLHDAYEDDQGTVVVRHAKHQFIDPEWYATYTIEQMMAGVDPLDAQGKMPTSHLRDARLKIYHVWSFRQVVMDHYRKAGLKP